MKLITREDYCMNCDGYPSSLYPKGRGTRRPRTLPCIVAIPDDNGTECPMLEFLSDGPYCIYCLGEQLYREISYEETNEVER